MNIKFIESFKAQLSSQLNPRLTWVLDIAEYFIIFIIVMFISIVAYLIVEKFFLRIISKLIKKTKNTWDDALLENKVFNLISHIAPALVIFISSSLFGDYKKIIQNLSIAYMLLIFFVCIEKILTTINDIYENYEISKKRPVKGYLQVIKIFVFIIGIIAILSTVLNRSPWKLLSGIGAMTAIIILVFKDSILGLVAGIQLTANNMVRIGDWIEIPQYGADGDVIEINLNSIIVRNFDRTITTVPIYALVSGSFKNWRGMSESDGRRIKRSFFIDMGSIKFCDNLMLEKFKKIEYLKSYLNLKEKDINEFNRKNKIDTNVKGNGRRLTNIGTLRAYVIEYLKNHPMINKDMTFLVRQLEPTANGLPLQVYVFCKDKVWVNYEGIQADIFDHILAILPEFDLKIFQNPTGSDFKNIIYK